MVKRRQIRTHGTGAQRTTNGDAQTSDHDATVQPIIPFDESTVHTPNTEHLTPTVSKLFPAALPPI